MDLDPLRIAARAVVAFVVLLLLVRASGKRTVKHGTAFEFTVAVLLGDLVDDVLWGEAGIAAFVVASSVIVVAQAICGRLAFAGSRRR